MARERIATWPTGRASRFSARTAEALSGTRVLSVEEIERFQSVAFDCNGAARNLDLPAEAACTGVYLFITNTTAATHALTVRDDGASTVVAIPAAGKSAVVWCDGVRWYALLGS